MSRQSHGIIAAKQVTPTIDTSAFASGDAMHTGIIEVANCLQYEGSGVIESVLVTDLDSLSTDFDILVFGEDISSTTTITANAALDVADADLVKLLGIVQVRGSDYSAFADNSAAQVECKVPIDAQKENRNLYLVLVSRDTDNFSTATALSIRLYVRQD